MIFWSGYERWVRDGDATRRVWVARAKCTGCRPQLSHALLPSFVCRGAALRSEAGVGSRVRTPDPLCAALEAAGHTYRRTDEGLAVVATPEQVGELAAQHSVGLHGLVGTADLERAFFRLIEESGPSAFCVV